MRNVILVADDSDSTQSQLADALNGNFVICKAKDEKEAIRLISENDKRLCALLVSASLPREGSLSVLKYIRATALAGKFPVMFISPFNFETGETKEFCGEIDDIIEKPFNVAIIKRRVKNMVELYNFRRSKMIAQQSEITDNIEN